MLTEGRKAGWHRSPTASRCAHGLNLQLDLDPATADAPTATSGEINLSVTLGAVVVTYDRLSMDPAHPRYLIAVLNADPGGLLTAALVEPPPPNNVATSIPRAGAAFATEPPQLGSDENLSALFAADLIAAIDTLRAIDDVNFIAVPDRPTAPDEPMSTVQQALIAHCELLGDRFAVLDSDPGVAPVRGGKPRRAAARARFDPRLCRALYPWLRVTPANAARRFSFRRPGTCAASSRAAMPRAACTRRRPTRSSTARSASSARISQIEQGQLNLARHQRRAACSRTAARPIAVGRAHDRRPTRNWQYVNIRRLFLYLEESIQEGIRWAVFEPNNLSLWQKLKRTITDFLTRAWRDGALFGAKAEEAFYVRIDEVLNPFSEQQLGRLHIEIGVRPSYPAEFIIVRIGIWDGGSDVSEALTGGPDRWLPRSDPYVNFNFLVEIDGITRAAFQRGERARLHDRRDRAPRGRREHHDAQDPGQVKFSNIMLKWGMTDDGELYDWHKQWVDGDPAAARKNGSIVLLDRQGQEKARWNFFNGWPSKWTGPTSTPRATTSRSRRSRSPTKAWRAPDRQLERRHVPDRVRVHAALRLPRRGRHAASRRRDAAGDGRRRDPAAARTRGCRRTRRIWSSSCSSRVITRLGRGGDQSEGDRGAVRDRPRVPAGALQPHQPAP